MNYKYILIYEVVRAAPYTKQAWQRVCDSLSVFFFTSRLRRFSHQRAENTFFDNEH